MAYNADGKRVDIFIGELETSHLATEPMQRAAGNIEQLLSIADPAIRRGMTQPLRLTIELGPNAEHGQLALSLKEAEGFVSNLKMMIAMAREKHPSDE